MKKKSLYYSLIILINLMPFIPLSIKGILGLVFIIISSIKSDLKESIRTAAVLIALQAFSYLMRFSVDYKSDEIAMIMGAAAYLAIAYHLGSFSESNRRLIRNMKEENEHRSKVEAELRQQIALQDCIMNTIPIPLYFKDLNFNYVRINSALSELLEIEEQEIIGKTALDLSDSEVAVICDQMDRDLIQYQDKQVKEITVFSNEDQMKSYLVSKAVFRDEPGESAGIVGVILDISEQKESKKLKNNIAELQQLDQLRTEFFSNISHELRTPLNVIFCAVQLIEMSLNDSDTVVNRDKIKRHALNMKQNCMRLQRLVNNLIDITRIDTHAFDLDVRNLNIVYVAEEITLSVADFISNKGINLLFDTDIEEKTMAFDEEKLERIILNLLSNAIKFTPEGGMIRVSIFDQDEHVIIRIKDTGIGIPPDKLQNIFNRFYQISPVSTRSQEGSGIGLNLVKSLVEMHQGEITVESELGKGTTFSLKFPCNVLPNLDANQPTSDKHSRIEKIRLEFSDIYNPANKQAISDIYNPINKQAM